MTDERSQTSLDDELRSTIFDGLMAVSEGQLEEAQKCLEQAKSKVGSDHSGVLHLEGVLAWCEGDIESSVKKMSQALEDANADPSVYLDFAELLIEVGENTGDAEEALNRLCEREDIEPEHYAQAKVLCAQIRLDSDDSDPEEALELLDEVAKTMEHEPYFHSLRAAALVDLGRAEEAISGIRAFLETHNDADLRYQLALILRECGQENEAVEQLLSVLENDRAELESMSEDGEDSTTDKEGLEQALRAQFEELYEELPEPLLKKVAMAKIEFQDYVEADQVRAGVDPRCPIAFLGQGVGDAENAKLETIALIKSMLFDEAESEEEMNEVMLIGMFAEFKRFFDIDGLEMVTAE